MSELSDSTTGLPDPDAEFFARVQFGRKPKAGEAEEKLYLDFEYPNLPYGGMVSIQKVMTETVLPVLVDMGEVTASMMDQEVLGVEQVKAALEQLRAPGKGPKK